MKAFWIGVALCAAPALALANGHGHGHDDDYDNRDRQIAPGDYVDQDRVRPDQYRPVRPEPPKQQPVKPPKAVPPKVAPPKVAPPKVAPPRPEPPKARPPKVAPPKQEHVRPDPYVAPEPMPDDDYVPTRIRDGEYRQDDHMYAPDDYYQQRPPAELPPPDYLPEPPRTRGLFVGLKLGLGHVGCDHGKVCGKWNSAWSLGGELGYQVDENWSLVAEMWGVTRTEDTKNFSLSQSQVIAAIGPQFHLGRVFLRPAVGVASQLFIVTDKIGSSACIFKSDLTAAISLTAGVNIYENDRFALNVQAKFGKGFWTKDIDTDMNNWALAVGVTF